MIVPTRNEKGNCQQGGRLTFVNSNVPIKRRKPSRLKKQLHDTRESRHVFIELWIWFLIDYGCEII